MGRKGTGERGERKEEEEKEMGMGEIVEREREGWEAGWLAERGRGRMKMVSVRWETTPFSSPAHTGFWQ